MKKLFLISTLIILSCSNAPEKNIFVWNYYSSCDEHGFMFNSLEEANKKFNELLENEKSSDSNE